MLINNIIKEIFNHQVLKENKLIEYGFEKNKDKYTYKEDIYNHEFILFINIYLNGNIETRLIEKETNEEYILHIVDEAKGSFVGAVREAYVQCLTDIRNCCFERKTFQGANAEEIINYVRKTYQDELEFLWENSESAIWRRKDNKKWYGILMNVSMEKLGLPSKEIIPILNVRIPPLELESILDNQSYFRAYHMNKKHWISLYIDTISLPEIIHFIDRSYFLALK